MADDRLLTTLRIAAPSPRRGEPVTFGVPLPPARCYHAAELAVVSSTHGPVPLQTHVLDRWPDGALRWVLLDFQASLPAEYRLELTGTSPVPAPVTPVTAQAGDRSIVVRTGAAVFEVATTGEWTLTWPDAAGGARRAQLVLAGEAGERTACVVDAVRLETNGPLRSCCVADGRLAHGLRARIRAHFFAGVATARLDITLWNPQRATHQGGFWELGDAGSVFVRDLSLTVSLPASPERRFTCSPEAGGDPVSAPAVEIYQESSGGENWRSPVHVNHLGQIPLRFRGYRLRTPGAERSGLRASPIVTAALPGGCDAAVSLSDFWQNFPAAIDGADGELSVRLLPRQAADLHELQGGEQKTYSCHLASGDDGIAGMPLEWTRTPAAASCSPEWYVSAAAWPYLTRADEDAGSAHAALIQSAIDGPESFAVKRERIDEYGWRNFGDLYADHEAGGHQGDAPFVSHYNNQYDAVAGFAIQFMRSGNPRWWHAMHDLARHVVDIDVYHTDQDKAAYNGGLFWHTSHYVDCGTSSHRSYPHAPKVGGGGPSNEHAYSTGLMLHHFLTGSEASRDAAVGLADWILAMDDGRKTVFRWIVRSDTGLASQTASPDYHGPGRGAGNAITTLLNAFRLTRDPRYLKKAEALVRRCINPADDVPGRGLTDPERRWSYTVFLQVLGRYLDEKALRGELDAAFVHARASLLAYARWMRGSEYPYLDKPDILDYPTETWAAQDIRKSDVFLYAARYGGAGERDSFLERADFFFTSSVETLAASPTRALTRPTVILLVHGLMRAWFQRHRDDRAPAAPKPAGAFAPPVVFTPQKQKVKQRLKAGALSMSLLILIVIVRVWLSG